MRKGREMKLKLTFILTLAAIVVLAVGSVWAQQRTEKVAHPYTKKSMPSALTAVKLAKISSSERQTTAVGDPVNMDAALVAGANYLKHAQADITEDNAGNGDPDVPDDPDDAGWDWKLISPDFTHSTAASSKNLYGATVQGLYYAYLETGNAAYMTAMQDAATYMIGDSDVRSAADLVFLMKFQDLPGDLCLFHSQHSLQDSQL